MIDPIWIDNQDALLIHERLLALHGGAPGLRDEGLLVSALARPRQHAAYGEHRELHHLAALYTAGILRNHPFVDGNKRTGFVLGVLFLELNGVSFVADQDDAAKAVLSLASGEIYELAYARFLAASTRPVASGVER